MIINIDCKYLVLNNNSLFIQNNVDVDNLYLQDTSQNIMQVMRLSNMLHHITHVMNLGMVTKNAYLKNNKYAIYLSLVDIQMYNNKFINNCNGLYLRIMGL